MTTSVAMPTSAPPETAELTPIADWRVVPARSRIRIAAGRWIGVRGTLRNVSGVVRLIEGQPRYTHVDIRAPVATIAISARRWLGLDAELFPFVSFYGWRVRGNPRRSFALDGELQVGEVRRQVVVNVVAAGSRIDDATGTEESTFHARLTLDRRIRVFIDLTLARQIPPHYGDGGARPRYASLMT
jgi:polyisoprenoid-binding protein YceI